MNREMPVKICDHHKPKDLGYIAWHDWAESMNKKGIEQSRCQHCKLYLFPEEMNDNRGNRHYLETPHKTNPNSIRYVLEY